MSLTPAEAEKLKTLPEWKALEAHIREAMALMDSCSSIPDGDDHDAAARGRKEAVRLLKVILDPFQLQIAPETDARREALKKLGLT